MTSHEIIQKVADFWIGMIQKSMSERKADPSTTFPTQETIDLFRKDLEEMLFYKNPPTLFSYSFVGLRGYQEVSDFLPWQDQTSTIVDWVTGKITVR